MANRKNERMEERRVTEQHFSIFKIMIIKRYLNLALFAKRKEFEMEIILSQIQFNT